MMTLIDFMLLRRAAWQPELALAPPIPWEEARKDPTKQGIIYVPDYSSHTSHSLK